MRKPAYKTIANKLGKIKSRSDYLALCDRFGKVHVDWVIYKSDFLLNEYQRATVQGYAEGTYQQLSLF